MKNSLLQVSVLAVLTALSACSKQEPTTQTPPVAEATQPAAADPLVASIIGEWRGADDKARDEFRHPKEALEFWGLAPGHDGARSAARCRLVERHSRAVCACDRRQVLRDRCGSRQPRAVRSC